MSRMLSILPTIARNRRRQDQLPRFMTYIVTFSCNARCIMCDSWRKPSPDDLTLEEIDRIFSQLPRMDAVRLSGGEPFVRKDLLDIAHRVQDKLKPLFLHITTNGFLTKRIVEFCEERRTDVPLQLLISMDGLEEKHNTVRGHKQAFNYVVKTLEALVPRRKELRLEIAVNQTIVDAEGAEHYVKLREFLKPYGVRNQCVMAYDASATYSLETETDVAPTQIGEFFTYGEFSQEQLANLFDEVEKDLAHYPMHERLAKRYYLDGIRSRLLDGGDGQPNPPCVALNSHLRIMPNGDVPTCQFNSKTAGNLRQTSFEELWFGEAAGKQRDWVRKCPGCWAECEVLPNAIYTGDIVGHSLANRVPAVGKLFNRSKPEPIAQNVPKPDAAVRRGLPVLSTKDSRV